MNIRICLAAVAAILATSCSQENATRGLDLADASVLVDAMPQTRPDSGIEAGLDASSHEDAQTGPSAKCVYPLVELRTGRDQSCSGGNTHLWPIGMAATDCHGWSAVDPRGRQHDNSANTIACNDDGSFTFTQYAGNLNCNGSGVVKTFYPGMCQQDIPPVLYTIPINLACCSNPGSPECVSDVPSVSVPGGKVFLNGEPCE